MEVLYPRCAGLDVHQASVVACVRIASGARASQEVRTFETTTKGLLALADWLREGGCTHVAMEATGVYWKPVWHVLEGEFELVLANAAHIRNVPGPQDRCQRCHLDRRSTGARSDPLKLRPPPRIQELRDLTRTRKQLVREVARHVATHAKDPRGRQHQDRRSHQRYPRAERARVSRCHHCWRDRSRKLSPILRAVAREAPPREDPRGGPARSGP